MGHSSSEGALQDAVAGAAAVGYQAVVGDLACDRGAIEALGVDPYDYWAAATVYFDAEAKARSFAAAYQRDVAAPRGVAKVTLGCLD
ncbi:MAG: hypothetical protein ACRC35_13805 [Angustibacter sp.]